MPSPRALAHLLPARELDQWRVYLELEPTGWQALNRHQAAIRLPHYKPKTKLADLMFQDPVMAKPAPDESAASDPPAAAGPPEGQVISPEVAIAWSEMALQMGVPGITRDDPETPP